MQDDAALESQSMQLMVADGLRARIIAGELETGVGLSEIALASEYGVSRTPVREALKQLQTEGLVQIRPRVGTFVSTPTRADIVELFQMKEILEGAAARLFAARGEIPELEALRSNVVASDAAVARDDVDGYAALVGDFHDLIVRGSGNRKLRTHYTMLMNQLAYPRLVATSLSRPGRLVESDAEHGRVLAIIVSKDESTAERLMREHVRASQEALLGAMTFPGETGMAR
ncbi:GntR family transcriptional regulator [Amnibacterium flavum]|uniref:GntR family transcriptional regulator n=1 Tax=Amnibacterium flavum TaxID=2173173 RepID=A0A2V1HWE7_9MICO|nr:GntR family transcriptional regulator [Amnibacterium flavum]PVZ96202.1 GntR family transcriptional regulator [Amnibacterium flavum]